jgi:hypothetical protein
LQAHQLKIKPDYPNKIIQKSHCSFSINNLPKKISHTPYSSQINKVSTDNQPERLITANIITHTNQILVKAIKCVNTSIPIPASTAQLCIDILLAVRQQNF